MNTPNLSNLIAFAARPRAAMSGEEWAKLRNATRAELARLKALAALAQDAMKLIDEMECAVEYDPLGGLSKQADALRKRYDALAGGKEGA